MTKLNVFYEEKKVGELKRDEELTFSFNYENSWLNDPKSFALSIALPLSPETFGNKKTLSFFENLLPEGEVREAIARAHNIESDFDFLKEFGEDCAGAVIVSADEVSPFKGNAQGKKLIDMQKVYEAIDHNHSVADVISETDPGYLSLAGAQDKFPAILHNGKFYLPENGAPTTHIVKVPIRRKKVTESVFNEFYCMELARRIGFNIPKCQVMGEGTHPLFVIERYDRFTDKNGVVHRIHQQDFCQAQGITSESKYEINGGPSIKANYELIKSNVTIKKRVQALQTFLDWVCFNFLIGNNDSHSKNISFLLNDGKIELAPLYDLISTAIYPKLQPEFSFKIGGRNQYHRIGKNQFEELDQELGVKVGTFGERMALVHDKVMKEKDALAEGMTKMFKGTSVSKKVAEEIQTRSKSLHVQKAL
jgi:serine/threonine-protein kinase HipA